jgi:hypothetical protein
MRRSVDDLTATTGGLVHRAYNATLPKELLHHVGILAVIRLTGSPAAPKRPDAGGHLPASATRSVSEPAHLDELECKVAVRLFVEHLEDEPVLETDPPERGA